MTIAPPDGLSRALQLGAEAAGYLEYTNTPSVMDKKKSRDLYKRAHKIMDAVVGLEEEGIYQTGPIPVDPTEAKFVDPAAHKIEMPEVPARPAEEMTATAATLVAEDALPPMPDLIGDFDQLHPEAQSKAFQDGLHQITSGMTPMPGPDAVEPWFTAFEEARLDTWVRLQYVLHHREPVSIDFPTDEEMSTWRAGFTPPPWVPEAFRLFDAMSPEKAQEQFSSHLDALGDATQAIGAQFQAWEDAWAADRRGTWLRLVIAGITPTFDIPTNDQVAAYLEAEHARENPVTEEVIEPTPAEFLRSWEGWYDEQRGDQFEAQMDVLVALQDELGATLDVDILEGDYDADPKETFQTVLYMVDHKTLEIPEASVVVEWVNQVMAQDASEDVAVDPEAEALGEDARDEMFEAKLDELEEAGIKESGLKRKAWKASEKAWRDAYAAEPAGTVDKLLGVLTQASVTWDVPAAVAA